MIISIQSSSPTADSGFDSSLQRAFNVLRAAKIRVLGGDRFMDGTGYVVLLNDADAPVALTALVRLGIRASELRPKSSPKHAG
jgi:hypothetical protein